MYDRGEVVYNKTDCDSKGEPTYKKLWIWEVRSAGGTLYTVKDGPGEKANTLPGELREGDLYEDFPKEEVNLIDL